MYCCASCLQLPSLQWCTIKVQQQMGMVVLACGSKRTIHNDGSHYHRQRSIVDNNVIHSALRGLPMSDARVARVKLHVCTPVEHM